MMITVTLDEEHSHLVRQVLASGHYPTEVEAVQAALNAFVTQTQQGLERALAPALADVEAGRVVEYETPEALREALHARARKVFAELSETP